MASAPLNITGIYNYYPYGMQIENRCYEAPANRFGFQGQQRDDEINGKGNTMNYEYRNYDAQVGIFKSIDPLAEKYADISPYAAFGLNPILYVDILGLTPEEVIGKANEYIGTPYEYGGKNPFFKNGYSNGMDHDTYLKLVCYPSLYANGASFNSNYSNGILKKIWHL